MNSATHAAIGAAVASVVQPELDVVAVAAFASQLPDIDTTESAIGAMFYPLAKKLEASGHRGMTHSLLFCSLCSAVALALSVYYLQTIAWGLAAAIGLFTSIIADCFTKQGVQLFWPWRVWCVVGLNPNRRLKSGSLAEYWIILVCGLILVFNFKFGGLDGLSLALPSNSSDIFLKYPTHCVTAQIKAVTTDYSIVSGEFLALSLSSFWRPGQLLSKANSTILSARYRLGDDCGVTVSVLAFADEAPTALQEYVGTYSFVFGSVVADEVPATRQFHGEPIGQAIDAIGSAWITGELHIRTYRNLP